MKWNCVISHQSALEFWQKTSIKDTSINTLTEKRLDVVRLDPESRPYPGSLDSKELPFNKIIELTLPLHILVGSENVRKVNRSFRCHICTGVFSAGSFIRVSPGVTVSSPELCFIQMAEDLDIIDMILLGHEFCGNYRLKGDNLTEHGFSGPGFRSDKPLTSVAKLTAYITDSAGLRGRKTALRALRFINDGSASPMESILTMLLTLPYRLGGYGFRKPLLNHRVDITVSTRKPNYRPVNGKSKNKPSGNRSAGSKGKVTYYCDLYWPDVKLDVEYDSDEYHTGTDRIAKDAIRRNALISADIKVVTVSRKQITEKSKLRESANIIAKILKKRLKCSGKDFSVRHSKLLRRLLTVPSAPARDKPACR